MEPRTNSADEIRRKMGNAKKSLLDELAMLRTTSKAQLAELHAIADALRTNEGHSSVDRIKDLKAELAAARNLRIAAVNRLVVLDLDEQDSCAEELESVVSMLRWNKKAAAEGER